MNGRSTFIVLCLLSGLLSGAEGWDVAFPAAAVCSYLPDGKEKVLIAAAGDHTAELADAVGALTQAVKKCERAQLVMDGAPLGDLSKADDALIVKKGAVFPVTIIVVIRHFEPNAVVTFYAKNGDVLQAFSTERGTALQPKEQVGKEQDGISQSIFDAVHKAVRDERKGTIPPSKEGTGGTVPYAKEFLWFPEWRDEFAAGPDPSTDTPPRIGENKLIVSWELFYKKVGREDLLIEMERRDKTKLGLFIGGLALGGVGVAFIVGGLSAQEAQNDQRDYYRFDKTTLQWEKQPEDPLGPYFWAGLAMTVTGTAAWVTGLLLDKNPASSKEVAEMARTYNRELRRRAGIPEPEEKELKDERIDMSLTPLLLHNGGGVNLMLDY